MRAEYLLRLDDACPTMDSRRWDKVQNVLIGQGVRPIVAIVPANQDPGIVRGPCDKKFWERAVSWAQAGWMIAMHGYSHALRPSQTGLVPVNRYSEFVGLPAEEQRRRVREGRRELEARGLSPEAWVAPAHGLDLLTLEALRSETRIRIISDSFTRRAVRRWGFVWIPQQLWRPRSMPWGLWTICLHPNEMDQADISRLASFVATHRTSFSNPRELAARAVPHGAADLVFETAFLSILRIRRLAHKGRVK